MGSHEDTSVVGMSAEPVPQSRSSATCAMLSVLGVAAAPVLFGMSLGFTAPAIDVMKNELKRKGQPIYVPDDLIVFNSGQAALFGSLINIGCIVGAISAGPVSERLGRKWTILMIAPIFAVSWLFTGLLSAFEPLLIARFVGGFAVGMTSSVVPTYINEVAPTNLRGAFGAVFQMAIVFGIMLVYLLGAYVFVKDGVCQWRELAYSFLIPAAILLVGAAAVPESPRWLASKGRLEQAQRNLTRLRGESPAQEMEELYQSSVQASTQQGGALRELLRNPKVLGIGCMLMLIQQFSGVNAIIFYQDTIFQDAGMDDPASLGFLVMLMQVVVTGFAIPLVDVAGRKVLLIVAAAGMAVCCLAMMIFFSTGESLRWLALVGSFAYLAFFSIGLGPVPWLMMGEIFPQSFRSLASSIGAALNWFCSFVTTETMDSLKQAITLGGVFGIYGIVLVLGVVYLAIFVPETKGRSLAEIERMLGIQQRDVPLITNF